MKQDDLLSTQCYRLSQFVLHIVSIPWRTCFTERREKSTHEIFVQGLREQMHWATLTLENNFTCAHAKLSPEVAVLLCLWQKAKHRVQGNARVSKPGSGIIQEEWSIITSVKQSVIRN